MLTTCTKCGKIHPYGYKCNKGRLPLTDEQALRNSSSWHNKSREIRERSLYVCAVCRDQNTINPADDIEVHHIIKLKNFKEGLLLDSNLICLCVNHHKLADRGSIDPDYLRELAKKRDETDFTPIS